MECEFNRTPYKRRLDRLDTDKEVLGRHLQDGVWENSKTPSKVLGSLQYSTMQSSRACQSRANGTAHMIYIL
jgi:hypothetical protein